MKDTIHMIPVDPAKKKRVFLACVRSTPTGKGCRGDPVKQVVIEEPERAGFEISAPTSMAWRWSGASTP